MLRTLATIYLVLSILGAIGVALGFFGGDMLFNLMAAFGVLLSALLMYAVLSAIEDMRDATVARDIKGKTCWAQSTCARNSGAIPTYAGHNYCAYSQVVVFGGTWGGAGSASTPGCY